MWGRCDIFIRVCFLGANVKQRDMKFGEYVAGVFGLSLVCVFGVYVVQML